MMNQELKDFALENDWYFAGPCVMGFYKGYYFQLNDEDRCKILSSDFEDVTEETREKIEAALLEKNKEVSSEMSIVTNNYIAIRFAELIPETNIETLREGLNSVAEVLAANSVPQGIGCMFCGRKDNLRYYYNTQNKLVKRVCPECDDTMVAKKNQEEKDKLFEERKYSHGIMGAVLFSFIGMVVWLFMSVYFREKAQFGVIVLGVLVLFGDTKFKTTKQSTPLWILVIIFIISVVITNYIIAARVFFATYSQGTMRILLYNLLYNSLLKTWIMKNILASLIISAIPVLILFFQKSTKINGPEWVMAEKISTNYEQRI
jgi:hypothetical protein